MQRDNTRILALLASFSLVAGIALAAHRCAADRELGANAVDEAKSRNSDSGTIRSNDPETEELPTKLPREPEDPVVKLVRDKLKSITIPVVRFEETSLEEALDFLRLRTFELDPDPELTHRGLAMMIGNRPEARSGRRLPHLTGYGHRMSITADNISAWDLLHRIADESQMVVRITELGFVELAAVSSAAPGTEE